MDYHMHGLGHFKLSSMHVHPMSSTLSPEHCIILISAGTLSPNLTSTISPTTSRSTGIVYFLPSLSTAVSF